MKLTTQNLMIEPALSGGAIVRFETMDLKYQRDLMHKYDGKEITVEIKTKRAGRSLDANAYCWVLCDKIAATKGLLMKKLDVYRQAIRDYGVSEVLMMSEEAAPKFKASWESEEGRYGKVCDILGGSPANPGYVWVKAYYGSSDYNTKEMSVLLDGIIADAQELGIQTETPDQIAKMKAEWGE